MERVFQIAAVVLGGIAAYFLWAGNGDGAFVSAVLGALAFFLSVRFQVKERNRIREAERERELHKGQADEIDLAANWTSQVAEHAETHESVERKTK